MKFKRTLLLSMVGIWIGLMNHGVQAASHVCGDFCSGAACTDECWLTQSDFDNGFPSTTCGDQGYSCCGDGVCDPETDACNNCTADCGTVSECGSCTSDSQCPSNTICNAARQCVSPGDPEVGDHSKPCGGDCDNDGDCCGSDVCTGSYGEQKECAIPDTTYCPDAASCNSTDDCYNWASSSGVDCDTYKDLYCDAGIGRCQFNGEPGCPDATQESLCFEE